MQNFQGFVRQNTVVVGLRTLLWDVLPVAPDTANAQWDEWSISFFFQLHEYTYSAKIFGAYFPCRYKLISL